MPDPCDVCTSVSDSGVGARKLLQAGLQWAFLARGRSFQAVSDPQLIGVLLSSQGQLLGQPLRHFGWQPVCTPGKTLRLFSTSFREGMKPYWK